MNFVIKLLNRKLLAADLVALVISHFKVIFKVIFIAILEQMINDVNQYHLNFGISTG
jgi:hypothetical protein